MKKRFYLFKYPAYNKQDIEKLMQNYDIILPNKSKFKNSIFEEYAKDHYKEDFEKFTEGLEEVIKFIKDKCPVTERVYTEGGDEKSFSDVDFDQL